MVVRVGNHDLIVELVHSYVHRPNELAVLFALLAKYDLGSLFMVIVYTRIGRRCKLRFANRTCFLVRIELGIRRWLVEHHIERHWCASSCSTSHIVQFGNIDRSSRICFHYFLAFQHKRVRSYRWSNGVVRFSCRVGVRCGLLSVAICICRCCMVRIVRSILVCARYGKTDRICAREIRIRSAEQSSLVTVCSSIIIIICIIVSICLELLVN